MMDASTACTMPGDDLLDALGETVILRRDPIGSSLDASVIEEVVPSGMAGLWHRHSREDEVSYVIEGTFGIWRGEDVFDLGPIGVALLPRNQAHTFQNVGPGTGRLLNVITPAGSERFFQEFPAPLEWSILRLPRRFGRLPKRGQRTA